MSREDFVTTTDDGSVQQQPPNLEARWHLDPSNTREADTSVNSGNVVMYSADGKDPRYLDGDRDEAGRLVLWRCVTWHGQPHPNPSGMILVVDPVFVPGEVLEKLLDPDDDAVHPAILTDRDFHWSPPFSTRNLELRVFDPFTARGRREWCGVCNTGMDFDGLVFFYDGDPVCDDCLTEPWKDVRRKAHEYADGQEAALHYSVDVGIKIARWYEALHEYAERFNAERQAASRSTA